MTAQNDGKIATEKARPEFIHLTQNYLENPDYDPAKLLDALIDELLMELPQKKRNDAALSRALLLPPPVVSKLRNKKLSVTDAILVRIYDVTGWDIDKSRELMGVTSGLVA
jgi:hypothetical protein